MTFLARILRYVFWLLIASWSLAILRRVVNNMGRGAHGSPEPHMDVPSDAVTQKLVRDPVCGMHLAEGLALAVREGGEEMHFCSPECREKYLSQTQRFVANA